MSQVTGQVTGQVSNRTAAPSLVPVVLAGFCAFVTAFAPQPILPLLAEVFHVGKTIVSLAVTACTLGVALAAPFMGQLADRIGRKRVIVLSALTLGVATLLTGTSPNLAALLFWRFVQGIATPGVFSVTTAYVHDEWPPARAASAISAYVSGTVVGGFAGRAIVGFVAGRWGWRWAFVVLGAISLSIAAYLAARLPRERHFTRTDASAGLLSAIADHLRNPLLSASYAVGSCVLFSITGLFTYVTFRLAGPPFHLGPGLIGSVYVVYLVGAVVTPFAGHRMDRDGHRTMMVRAAIIAAIGALVSLIASVWAVVAGLAICCTGLFIAQAAATSFVGTAAKHNRALALGLYVSSYYAGGSVGGVAPGWLWDAFGWPGCVALVVAVQFVIATIAWSLWAPIPGSPRPTTV